MTVTKVAVEVRVDATVTLPSFSSTLSAVTPDPEVDSLIVLPTSAVSEVDIAFTRSIIGLTSKPRAGCSLSNPIILINFC